MADLSFYIGDNIRIELFEFLQKNGSKLIPNGRHPSSSPTVIKDCSEFIRVIEEESVGFFIINSKYSKQNLLLEENKYSTDKYYLVMQRYGGQYIDLSLYRGFSEDSVIKYKRTDLSHYSRYIDLNDNSIEHKASEELKLYYKEIISFLKSRCRRIKRCEKNYWVAKNIIDF